MNKNPKWIMSFDTIPKDEDTARMRIEMIREFLHAMQATTADVQMTLNRKGHTPLDSAYAGADDLLHATSVTIQRR